MHRTIRRFATTVAGAAAITAIAAAFVTALMFAPCYLLIVLTGAAGLRQRDRGSYCEC